MKHLIFLLGLLSCLTLSAQKVGVNTRTPVTTLDVMASPSDLTVADGFLAPRLKGSELKSKDNNYTAQHHGTLVFVTEALASSDVSDKTTYVTEFGYYYFDKDKGAAGRWIPLKTEPTTSPYKWAVFKSAEEQDIATAFNSGTMGDESKAVLTFTASNALINETVTLSPSSDYFIITTAGLYNVQGGVTLAPNMGNTIITHVPSPNLHFNIQVEYSTDNGTSWVTCAKSVITALTPLSNAPTSLYLQTPNSTVELAQGQWLRLTIGREAMTQTYSSVNYYLNNQQASTGYNNVKKFTNIDHTKYFRIHKVR